MSLNFYQKLTALFLVFFVGIVVIGFLAFRNNVAFAKSTKWVEHTQQVLDESEKIFSLTQSIANGERGYIITADSEFLQPFINSREKVFLQIGKLKSLTADNPIQQERIDSINMFAQKRVDVSDRIIATINRGDKAAATQIIIGKEGKNLSQKVRDLVTELQTDENNLLKQRKASTEQRMEVFNRFLWGLFGGLLVLLTLTYLIFIHNHLQQRKLDAKVLIAVF